MFKVDPISKEDINGWTIQESGLPARVVNSAHGANLSTISQLRDKSALELTAMRSIGRVSVRDIRRFFNLCRKMEEGTLVFITIQEVFDLFLDQEEMDILARRYGLMRPDAQASRKYMTLQEIGNELQLTRERIRQVINIALSNLRKRLATRCLQPFNLYLRAFIDSRGKVASCEDARDLEGQSWLAGYNPCSMLLLLHDLNPDAYAERHGTFSTFSPDALQRVEQRVLAFLRDRGKPTALPDIVAALDDPDGAWSETALVTLLDHIHAVAGSTDGRYFLFATGQDLFLAELFRDAERPAHYRTLTALFNDHLKAPCRKGSGYVLKLLNASTRFIKAERGYYDLADF